MYFGGPQIRQLDKDPEVLKGNKNELGKLEGNLVIYLFMDS